MSKVLDIVSYVVLPLAWGLAVEFVFAWLRGRRRDLTPEEDVE